MYSPVLVLRQVPMVQKAHKTAEVPHVLYIDKVVDMSAGRAGPTLQIPTEEKSADIPVAPMQQTGHAAVWELVEAVTPAVAKGLSRGCGRPVAERSPMRPRIARERFKFRRA